ncbi:hypothetical protein [Nannocystis pusilla]|uniref:hypothetical protein n=1 Tax=Nannocystis pusilla TaxID=889268 RepID=UPI003B7CFC84
MPLPQASAMGSQDVGAGSGAWQSSGGASPLLLLPQPGSPLVGTASLVLLLVPASPLVPASLLASESGPLVALVVAVVPAGTSLSQAPRPVSTARRRSIDRVRTRRGCARRRPRPT